MNGQNPNTLGGNAGQPWSSTGAGGSPPLIPPTGGAPNAGAPQPPGSNALEQTPINGIFGAAEALLRQPRRVMFQLKQPNAGALIVSFLIITLISSAVYGLVAGMFSGGDQIWAAPAKIVIGLIVSALLCLPSLYIFSCLSGSQARLIEVFGLLTGLLALMTMLLLGFSPVAWVFTQSTKSLVVMGTLLLAFWFVATIFGLRFLHTGLSHTSTKSDGGYQVWVIIFLLVSLQMTTALRPILGRSTTFLPPAAEKKFFLQHWFDNFDTSNPGEHKKSNYD